MIRQALQYLLTSNMIYTCVFIKITSQMNTKMLPTLYVKSLTEHITFATIIIISQLTYGKTLSNTSRLPVVTGHLNL